MVVDWQLQLNLKTTCFSILHLQLVVETRGHQVTRHVVSWHFVLQCKFVLSVQLYKVLTLRDLENHLTADDLFSNCSSFDFLDSLFFNLFQIFKTCRLQLLICVNICLFNFIVHLFCQVFCSSSVDLVINQIISCHFLDWTSSIHVFAKYLLKFNEIDAVVSIFV